MIYGLLSCLLFSDKDTGFKENIFPTKIIHEQETHTIRFGEGTSDEEGLIHFLIDLESDQSTLLLQAQSPNYLISLEELKTPQKTIALHWSDWYNSKQMLTESFFAEGSYVTFNYPILESQKLSAGTWEVIFAVVDENFVYQENEYVEIYGIVSHDIEKSLSLKIIFDDRLISQDIIDLAIAKWQFIYSSTNIALDIEYQHQSFDQVLYPPHMMYQELSSQSSHDEIVIVLTDSIASDIDTLGIVGSIPGSSFSSPSSIVLISWLGIAGIDGEINTEEEIRMLAETFGHEVGHYMGLFHPVEDNFRNWDALEDTPECSRQYTCEQQLQNNLMFPYPVCNYDVCLEQTELTADQIKTMTYYAPL